ncbi:ribosomal protein S18-alanine N-acetyltransferase [Aliiroseovarius sp. S1339]|uniref:ribosomal protein S18-alanine N-acetyltransferase n=1 Tax=Aliiroseovarius sp. S1339 TaxID=2936990 RepID=UPI00202AF116|nr:ribosomal protein S18-alanine N-acetyltransferase [Aliiroseovarius sp. S1339]MCK8462957.1 ribosomal protein S18-alanine N-acetyltransferase [Aliiroseovarius sp. S1339]
MTDATADTIARLHAAAFQTARAWSVDEMEALLASPHIFVVTMPHGFAMGRVIVDEAELLTVAVHREQQGKGIGRQLLQQFEQQAQTRGATRAFLEVAQDNETARALYLSAGWTESGRRTGYYARRGSGNADAILLHKHLPLGEPSEK